ncbi:MAG: hypothetical protein M1546_09395 [Chloroflexi bacterium]|nr:hypothetical protein [Chloroflexota bacterium]
MTVDNQPRVQRINAHRQTPIETAWDTLNSVQQERVLRAVVLVCCQIASALRAKPDDRPARRRTKHRGGEQ